MNLKSPEPVRRSQPLLTSVTPYSHPFRIKQRISYQSLDKLSTEQGRYVAFWTGDLGRATWLAYCALNFSTNWESATFASDEGGDCAERLGGLRTKGLVANRKDCRGACMCTWSELRYGYAETICNPTSSIQGACRYMQD